MHAHCLIIWKDSLNSKNPHSLQICLLLSRSRVPVIFLILRITALYSTIGVKLGVWVFSIVFSLTCCFFCCFDLFLTLLCISIWDISGLRSVATIYIVFLFLFRWVVSTTIFGSLVMCMLNVWLFETILGILRTWILFKSFSFLHNWDPPSLFSLLALLPSIPSLLSNSASDSSSLFCFLPVVSSVVSIFSLIFFVSQFEESLNW